MYTGLIAKRYATALIDFAAANAELPRVYDEVRLLIDAYRSDASIRAALFSPVLPAEAKLAVVRQSFDGPVSRSLDSFVRLVIRHRREHFFNFMLHSFTESYKRRNGIHDATLVTATPVDDLTVEHAAAVAREKTHGSRIDIRREIDESLVGGFVLRIDDLLLDASLSTQLERLRRKLGTRPNRIV